MPRVVYDATKGLHQTAGKGFALDAILTTTGSVTLDGTKSVVILTGNHTVTLPADANAKEGDIIIVICTGGSSGNVASTNANAGSGALGTGDLSICVYNGTQWIVGASAA